MTLPTDAKARKAIPIYTGFVVYFPKSICAIAELSALANEQHNPGQPVHWAKEKSTDEKDALMRHLVDPLVNGGDPYDSDRVLHATKKAWRAIADLERLLDTGIPTLRPEAPAVGPEQIDDLCGIPDVMRGVEPSPDLCVICPHQHVGHRVILGVHELYCADCGEKLDPTTVKVLPKTWLMLGIKVPRCCCDTPEGTRCILSDGHPGAHKAARPPTICSDCGADLDDGFHAATCLRLNRQHY